ncbi:MAG: Putative two-component sensor histidine kinase [Anaerolinea thermophila]|uniref:histidine kinase n=1 Tax=Anaerolinea thermophila TaxID=167964 RepID=A0A124FMW9_9CHLR|nr:MAG: Putative two-component sensor histidine kinase [Anaerolinea thermophila]
MLPDIRVRQRDYLLEISRAVTEELDLDKLLSRILKYSIELLAGHAGFIALSNQYGHWSLAVSNGLPEAVQRFLDSWLDRIPPTKNPKNILIPEINNILSQISMGTLSAVGLPLVAQGEVIGLIYIFRNYHGTFSTNDRSLLSSFATQAAIAVRNARLYTEVNREKQRVDAILDSAADGILILNPDHCIERTNAAFARMYGLPQETLQTMTHEDVIQWAKDPHGITLGEAEAGGWPLSPQAHLYVEGDLRRPNGQPPLPVGITYAPLISTEGSLLNTIATIRDITRFRQADELKSEFVSIVSHELKTPVALIKGYVSTLRRDDVHWDPEIMGESLQVIEEEADHLTRLIEDLLDASRLQAGGMPLKRSDVAMVAMAERLAERFQVQTEDHQIIVDLPDDLPVVMADETRIEQVLSNLISNAIKYAPDGKIVINGCGRPQEILICVADEGPGIPAGDLPHIFDRFYRAPETSRKTKGAGLGLYLAQAIIEAHGGRIWADPKPDKGTRICFSLPRD